MSPMFCRFSFCVVMLASFSLAGCGNGEASNSNGSAGDHDHDHDHGHDHDEHGHAHPESLAEALTQVEELYAEMKAAFAEDDLEKADGPLHEIGHVLEALPELAAKESLPEADQEQIKTAAEALLDRYGEVDERIHGGEGKSYDDVAAQVDEAIATLKAIKLPEGE